MPTPALPAQSAPALPFSAHWTNPVSKQTDVPTISMGEDGVLHITPAAPAEPPAGHSTPPLRFVCDSCGATLIDGEGVAARRLIIGPSFACACGGKVLRAEPPAQPAAEPAGITLTVEAVYQNFGTAYSHDQASKRYLLNTGTAGIALASLKPGMRLVAVVNEWNYVVSAKVEGE